MAMASAASLRLQVASPFPPQSRSLARWNRRPQHRIAASLVSVAAPPSLASPASLHALAAMPLLVKSMVEATRSALHNLATALTSMRSIGLASGSSGRSMLLFASMSTVSTPLTVVASGMAKWLELYSAVMMIRVLLSWFPNIPWEKQPFMAIRDMCDPYLNLFRNIIPPVFNALDLSPLLAFMVLGTMATILNSAAQT